MTSERPLRRAISAHYAAENAPQLANLARRAQESAKRLAAVLPLIPDALKTSVQAGGLDEKSWCLIVTSNAVAAKIRQLMPLLEARLHAEGLAVAAIRVKILIGRK